MHNFPDRYVHASAEGEEIVRYDRQGHWYIERVGAQRKRVLLGEAVARAKQLVDLGGTVHFGERGGLQFDKRLR